jgi:hypothetical protein
MGANQTSDDSVTPEAKDILAIERVDYFKIGFGLTAAYLLVAAAYSFFMWDVLIAMKPNEFGDFLAGIFGPLVLLWVVMGFLQQGAELKYSREALLLQAKELKASVEAQKNMGEAAWAGVHAERDARSEAEKNRIRAVQPVFTLHYYTHSTFEQSAETVFSLANSGRDGVDLEFELPNPHLSVTPRMFPRFTSAERVQIKIHALVKEDMADCTLLLRYKDLEGRIFARQFNVRVEAGLLLIDDAFGQAISPP